MLVIGIAGPMGSGKSTIAKILAERLHGTIVPMAKPLKEMATTLGWDGKKDKKGRKFLQLLGTEIGRAYDNEYWTKQWRDQVEKIVCHEAILSDEIGGVIICDDVRFPNEARAILNMGGMVVQLTGRNEIPTWKLILNDLIGWIKPIIHASELPLSPDLITDWVDNGPNCAVHHAAERIIWINQ